MPQSCMQERVQQAASRAQGMVEYGLILGLIAILVVTIFVTLRGVVDIGNSSGGAMSEEGMGRNQASLSAGLYD